MDRIVVVELIDRDTAHQHVMMEAMTNYATHHLPLDHKIVFARRGSRTKCATTNMIKKMRSMTRARSQASINS